LSRPDHRELTRSSKDWVSRVGRSLRAIFGQLECFPSARGVGCARAAVGVSAALGGSVVARRAEARRLAVELTWSGARRVARWRAAGRWVRHRRRRESKRANLKRPGSESTTFNGQTDARLALDTKTAPVRIRQRARSAKGIDQVLEPTREAGSSPAARRRVNAEPNWPASSRGATAWARLSLSLGVDRSSPATLLRRSWSTSRVVGGVSIVTRWAQLLAQARGVEPESDGVRIGPKRWRAARAPLQSPDGEATGEWLIRVAWWGRRVALQQLASARSREEIGLSPRP